MLKSSPLLFLLVLIQNCVVLKIHTKREILKKELKSQKVESRSEPLVVFSKEKDFLYDAVNLTVERMNHNQNLIISEYQISQKITEEYSGEYYIIGGIIPFVVEEKDLSLYWAIAFFTSFYSLPITLGDWISLPFRTGVTDREIVETESKIVEESKRSVTKPETYEIYINEEKFSVIRNRITIPYESILKNWNSNPTQVIYSNYPMLHIRVDQETFHFDSEIPVAKIINQNEFLELKKKYNQRDELK